LFPFSSHAVPPSPAQAGAGEEKGNTPLTLSMLFAFPIAAQLQHSGKQQRNIL
jgi:hypothetical protein